MRYGGSQGAAGPGPSDLIYTSPNCGLPAQSYSSHDSGIDISSSDVECCRSEGSETAPTHEIIYHDTSLSDDASSVSLSDPVKPARSPETSAGSRRRHRKSPSKTPFDINDNSLVAVYSFIRTFLG